MRIPIVPDGYNFLIPVAILALAFFFVSPISGGIWLIMFLIFLNFYRDPERTAEKHPNVKISRVEKKKVASAEDGRELVLAPADGVVDKIEEVEVPEMGNRKMLRISIFLNVFNVHVQRTPVKGKVVAKGNLGGGYSNANDPGSARSNGQTWIVLDIGNYEVMVKQIVGLFARRIVCWAQEGDHFLPGDRYGFIHFGSRVDLFLPPDSEVLINDGRPLEEDQYPDKSVFAALRGIVREYLGMKPESPLIVKGGQTVIGFIPQEQP